MIHAFSNSLVAAWKYAQSYPYQCSCPGCTEKAIKSHLLQQHPILASISDEKNHLLQMVDNTMDPRSGNWDFYNRRKVGIRNALQLYLFCGAHDSGLFKDLESRNCIPESKQDCLLLAYRAACAVRHQEERRLHIYEKEREVLDQSSPLESNSRAFILRMNVVVDNLWKAINGDGDNHYLFRMISMPRIDIAASDCMIDDTDLESHFSEECYDAPLNCLFINLIPRDGGLLLLLGCDTRYDEKGEYKRIIMDFPTGDLPRNDYLGTLKGVLLKCSNWCCSPKLYDDSDWRDFFDKYEALKVISTDCDYPEL